ncbi:uncharacterized protein LOC116580125 [Mustela erminea]|uniref:uncharacterized protein LOC116580125 n=1 Tax=Mustela erminea TaxID=36723 RepID=UPI00138685DC|nr:uncharacterized protein LOC116580125 [Mustela erminea]
MAGGGATCRRRGGPGARYLRSGGGCCFREPPLLQNGGAGDGSREPRAGQVTRVAGRGAGRYAGPAHGHPGAFRLGRRGEVPFRSCFKTFHVWRWERSRGLVLDSKRQRKKSTALLQTKGKGRCIQRPPTEQRCQWTEVCPWPSWAAQRCVGIPIAHAIPSFLFLLQLGYQERLCIELSAQGTVVWSTESFHGAAVSQSWVPTPPALCFPCGPYEHLPPCHSHIVLRRSYKGQPQVHVQDPEWPMAKDCLRGRKKAELFA